MRPRYCGQCGGGVEPSERYCVHCGQQLRGADGKPAPEPDLVDPLAQAVSLLAHGEAEHALASLEVICSETPARAIARAYRGTALLRLARVAEARAELEEAVRLAPDSFVCRVRYGEFLMKLGFYDQGLAQLDAALALPAPGEGARNAALELRKFGAEKTRGMFYRRISSPKEMRLRNLLPSRGGPALRHSTQVQGG